MTTLYRKSRLLSICILSLLLTACGGGGGSDSNEGVASDVKTGKLTGVSAQGLYYETETLKGLTNDEGEFQFREGEFIRFSVGNTQLGSAQAQNEINPFDLLGLNPPTEEAELVSIFSRPMLSSFDLVINACALLFSLDADGNPENGVDLGTAHKDLGGVELELAVKSTEFAQQPKTKATILRQVNREPVSHIDTTRLLYENLDISLKTKRTTEAKTKTGTGTLFSNSSSAYNEDGLLKSEKLQASIDNPAIDISYEYDDAKRLTRTTNSFTKQIEELSYQNDRLVERVIQTNAGEQIQEAKETISYSASGKISKLEQDLDGDGQQDVITEFSYGSTSEQIKVIQINDGVETQSLTTKRFKNGRIDEIIEDYNNDGEDDVSIRYEYDQQGRMIRRSITSTDETIESGLSEFQYDDQDRMIRYTLDKNKDNQVDYIESSAYDINGNQTDLKRDLNADGQWDFVAIYRFDDKGNRIEASEDNNGDGIVDKHWRLELKQESVDSDFLKKGA